MGTHDRVSDSGATVVGWNGGSIERSVDVRISRSRDELRVQESWVPALSRCFCDNRQLRSQFLRCEYKGDVTAVRVTELPLAFTRGPHFATPKVLSFRNPEKEV